VHEHQGAHERPQAGFQRPSFPRPHGLQDSVLGPVFKTVDQGRQNGVFVREILVVGANAYPALAATALVLNPRNPSDSKTRALASRMTFTVSFDLACPGSLRASSVLFRSLPLPSRRRVLFASIYSYCRQ
jgi:hypothetical protein